jgi:dTDP-4-amino-4,6-dideoxygalactose transaminase
LDADSLCCQALIGIKVYQANLGENSVKSSANNLAIFGGAPAFDEALHVGRPNIGNRQKFEERVGDILDRKWLTNAGYYVKEFELRVAELVGVKHCISMCNATVALEITIRGLGFRGEVIVPSFTFIATPNALQWQQITPIFCDIDPETHNLDSRKVEQMITPQTTGIIGVHVWGRPCNIEALTEIAAKHNLKLMFDSAHAFGCSYKGKMIGGFGDAEVFSFHGTKFVNTLEGGAVVTNDSELAQKIRLMKNFGFTDYDRTDYIGINGKLNEISAAMGLTNLESMKEFININYRNYKQYQQKLAGIDGLKIIEFDNAETYNYQYVVIEVDASKTIVPRDKLIEILHAENILARRYFYPGCHRMEPYRSYFPHAGLMLPETEKLTERVIILPTGTGVATDQINRICNIIGFAVNNGEEINGRISSLYDSQK